MRVGFEIQSRTSQGLGAFRTSVYAGAQVRSDDLGKFLGCVHYSQFWESETNDVGSLVARIAAGFLLASVTFGTMANISVQCFSKSGKTHVWNFMRVCYIIALISQLSMYAFFASEMCNDMNGEQICWLGVDGIVGIVNSILLFDMVVASFISFPPRNPVFQCWENYDDEFYCHIEDGSTGDEDEEDDGTITRVSKKSQESRRSRADEQSASDGVSLFGGSRLSRRSRRSSNQTSKSRSGKGKIAVEEKDASQANSDEIFRSDNSTKCPKSYISSQTSFTVPGNEKYPITSEVGSTTVNARNSVKNLSSTPVVEKTSCAQSNFVSTKLMVSASSTKKGNSSKSEPAAEPYLVTEDKCDSEEVTAVSSSIQASVVSQRSLKSSNNNRYTFQLKKDDLSGAVAQGLSDENVEDLSNFMELLFEITELNSGGRRVKVDRQQAHIEIVDEYPRIAGGEIESNPSSDLVKIRTEYYDLGSRTVKEISHSEGSRTVITTISTSTATNEIVLAAIEPTEPLAPNNSAVDMSYSNGLIKSPSSPKYRAPIKKLDP